MGYEKKLYKMTKRLCGGSNKQQATNLPEITEIVTHTCNDTNRQNMSASMPLWKR
jgi:hypothetical protein